MTNIVERINLTTGQDFTKLGTTDHAKVGRCPKCAAPVITGLDSDPAGLPVRADPQPLTDTAAELIALIEGKQTFALRKIGGRARIRHRDADAITQQTPDTTTVISEHKCDPRENNNNG